MENTDALTNTFSEEGRIHQVEYAIKSVTSAGPAIGVRFANGVVLLGKNTDNVLTLTQDEKIYRINPRTIAVVGGLYADSNLLVHYARVKAQEYLHNYNQDMSPWLIGKTICKIKQRFTQGGGMRPFGVSFMLAGYADNGQYHLLSTDPSGTLNDWNVFAFGENDKIILSSLEEYPEQMSMEEALLLAFKALSSTSEGVLKSPDAIAATVVYSEESVHKVKELTKKEVAGYLEKVQVKRE
ncbi:2S proteasome subunit alpha 3 [Nematocida displodere]|uniref:2S proteasome subunit alpha 3 n=1 Tax=Nematocida displodere TaxID=1805483 RepID=A0A177EJ05_9MICR|nr:2S proteasome subunit alpha 3 [Nematocida displodere]